MNVILRSNDAVVVTSYWRHAFAFEQQQSHVAIAASTIMKTMIPAYNPTSHFDNWSAPDDITIPETTWRHNQYIWNNMTWRHHEDVWNNYIITTFTDSLQQDDFHIERRSKLKDYYVRLRFCVKLNWSPTLSIRISVLNLGIFGKNFFFNTMQIMCSFKWS